VRKALSNESEISLPRIAVLVIDTPPTSAIASGFPFALY
jgi:hypothetical protein